MSKEEEIKLKPCPFCGSEAELTKIGIHCKNAGNVENCCNVFLVYPARGTVRTQQEIEDDIKMRSIKAWNNRVVLLPQDRIEKLQTKIDSLESHNQDLGDKLQNERIGHAEAEAEIEKLKQSQKGTVDGD